MAVVLLCFILTSMVWSSIVNVAKDFTLQNFNANGISLLDYKSQSFAITTSNGVAIWSIDPFTSNWTQTYIIPPPSGASNFGTAILWDDGLGMLMIGATNYLYMYEKTSNSYDLTASYSGTFGKNVHINNGLIVSGLPYAGIKAITYNPITKTFKSNTTLYVDGSYATVYNDNIGYRIGDYIMVYQYSSGSWRNALSSDNDGVTSMDMGDKTFAVGRSGSDQVLIYRATGNSWSTSYTTITGKSKSKFGAGVSVSPDGLIISVMASADTYIPKTTGATYTYMLDTDGTWKLHQSLYAVDTIKTGALGNLMDIVITPTGYIIAVQYTKSSIPGALVYSVGCSTATTGGFCNLNCQCSHGSCYTGMWYPQYCIDCDDRWRGLYCNKSCECINGDCNDGIYGTGRCNECYKPITNTTTGWIGTYCNKTCSCIHGKCHDGINGTGLCTVCNENYYNLNCSSACTCSSSQTCAYGIYGDNICSECPRQTYGPNCTNCTCTNGLCSEGSLGDGSCIQCNDGYYGPNCTKCQCRNGLCDGDVSGSGLCSKCYDDWSGQNCDVPSSCVNGITSSGLTGTGLCIQCVYGWYGIHCNKSCTCLHGQCKNDIDGDGTCRSCDDDYYGINCDKKCICTNGNCYFGITGNGKCLSCFPNYAIYNGTCNSCPNNITCSGSSTPVITNNTASLGNIFYSPLNVENSQVLLNNFELVGDLWTSSSIYSISNVTTINGNANFYDTGLYVGASAFNINGNLVLVGGTTTITNNSTINVTQCVTITNTTFIVDDSDTENLDTKSVIDVLYADPHCSNITNANLVINSQSSCKQVTSTKPLVEKGLSFEVTYDTSGCLPKPTSLTSQSWFIGTVSIACIVFLIILIILMVFTNPGVKEVIFPFREQPPDLYDNKKIGIQIERRKTSSNVSFSSSNVSLSNSIS